MIRKPWFLALFAIEVMVAITLRRLFWQTLHVPGIGWWLLGLAGLTWVVVAALLVWESAWEGICNFLLMLPGFLFVTLSFAALLGTYVMLIASPVVYLLTGSLAWSFGVGTPSMLVALLARYFVRVPIA